MDIQARSITDAGKHNSGCAVVPVFSRKKLSAAANQLDKSNKGLITGALRNGDIQGALGETLMLQTGNERGARRILLVGAGRASKLDIQSGRKITARLAGSIAAALAALERGAQILRVHDVAETVQAIAVWRALRRNF